MGTTTALLCAAETSQLVVIDVQVRLAAAMPPEVRERVVKNTAILLQAARLLELPVIATEQYPKGLGNTEDDVAQHFPAQLDVVCKTCFASSGAAGFNAALDAHRGRHQVILAGMEAHVCVLQTAMELLGRGYQVFVVEDAVSSRDEANRQNAMARLRQAGAIVTNTESVVFEWLRDAAHPQFKAITALIK
ncbi:isochorismatase family protein [Sulfurivermis fontis]|uniref:isochorismatase family protein n=1 Tax=Sulfurivermis fontis TaxID=1972068 RepID=UPI000FD93104|nr:isochorismatase family protein [Sulfurivermis fontis]